MRRRVRIGVAVLTWLAALGGPAAASAEPDLPPGFELRTIAGGFERPVGFAFAPDGRIFVVEQAGVVKVVDGGSVSTVLDLSSTVNSAHTRGLLGVAVDRDFAGSGYVYLLYTAESDPLMPDARGPTVSRLSRITVRDDGSVENPSDPETVLVGTSAATACARPHSNDDDCIPADATVHAIGSVRVDPGDGTIWFGSGDAAALGSDVSLRAYDENTYAGKLMHVDRDGRGLPGHPFCPGEADLTRVCTKIHSKGFRNPFRFTLRGGGEAPVVGDVGWVNHEELNLPAAGASYGWPCHEGAGTPDGYRDLPECTAEYAKGPDAHLPPALDYPHTQGTSITGGPLYEATRFPADYRGNVFYADYVAGWMRRARLTVDDRLVDDRSFATGIGAAVDIQVGPDGDLYFVDIAAGALRAIGYPVVPSGRTHTDREPPDAGPVADTPSGVAEPPPRAGSAEPSTRGSASAPAAAKLLALRLPRGGIRASRDGRVRVKVVNPTDARASVKLRMTSTRTRSGDPATIALAPARLVVPAGAKRVAELRLSRRGRALLARHRRVAVRVVFTARDATGGKAREEVKSSLLAPRRR